MERKRLDEHIHSTNLLEIDFKKAEQDIAQLQADGRSAADEIMRLDNEGKTLASRTQDLQAGFSAFTCCVCVSAAMGVTSELWYVGILLEVVSTMSGTIGKQLIRASELLKKRNPAISSTTYYIGIAVNTVVGPILDMAAYSFAAQSLIAPFGGLDVVWNALLAPYTLNEELTPRRAIGCALIVVGATMAGCFGNHLDAEYTVEYLEETFVNVRVLAYGSAFFAWFLFNRFVLMRKEVGSAIRGISLGCTAGTIAGNMFCVKAAVELIQRSIHEQDGEIWLHWLPYVSLLGAAFFALSNVVYMTRGLQEYETLFMVTIYEGSMIVSGCVSGAIVLLDMRGIESWRVGLYSLSVLIVISGMYVIFSQEKMSRSSHLTGKASIVTEDILLNSNSGDATLMGKLDQKSSNGTSFSSPIPPSGCKETHCPAEEETSVQTQSASPDVLTQE